MFPRILSALAAVAVTLALAGGAVAAPPAALALTLETGSRASASAGTPQWSVAPASGDGPDGRISLRHTVDPGGSALDAVAVTNLGAEPAAYVVASGDGIVGDDGAFDIASGDPRDAGAWVSIDGLDAGTVTLAPGETRVLPVRIDVPAGVTPGDHPAGIVVGMSRDDGGVTVTNRIGVRVHLQVAGEIVPALEAVESTSTFRSSWIPFAPGVLRVETRVANSGNVRLGAVASVSGFGVEGSSTPEPVELLPGDDATVVTETAAWPLFALSPTAQVRAVALGADAVTAPPSIETPLVVPAVSWSGLAVVVLAAGAIVVPLVSRRRRRGADSGAVHADDAASESRLETSVR